MEKLKRYIKECVSTPWDYIYIAELFLIFVLVLSLVRGRSLWYDEAFSWNIIHKSYSEIVYYTSRDVHPPLYYFILKFFTDIFGDSRYVCHLVSAIPFMATLVFAGAFIGKRFTGEARVVVTLLMLSAPAVMLISTEERMYSWAELMLMISFVLSVRLAEKREVHGFLWEWVGLGISDALAAYFHYFAGAVAIVISVLLMIYLLIYSDKRLFHLKYWVTANLISVVLYLPWLSVFFLQLSDVKGGYWIEKFSPADIPGYLKVLFGDDVVMFCLLALLAAAAVVMILMSGSGKSVMIPVGGILVTLLYMALGITISILVTPVFHRRYMVLAAPIFWLSVGLAFYLKPQRAVRIALAAVAVAAFIGSYRFVYDYRVREYTIYNYLNKNMDEDDVILSNNMHVAGQMSVCFPDTDEYIAREALEDEVFKYWDEITPICFYDDPGEIATDDTVWLLIRGKDETLSRQMEDMGYEVTYCGKKTAGDHLKSIKVKVYRCKR